jgi:hypothetical protein
VLLTVVGKLIIGLLGLGAAAVGVLVRPDRVVCAPGYYNQGVRPTGRTTCRQEIPEDLPDRDVPGFGQVVYPVRVYCPTGKAPRAMTFRAVGSR